MTRSLSRQHPLMRQGPRQTLFHHSHYQSQVGLFRINVIMSWRHCFCRTRISRPNSVSKWCSVGRRCSRPLWPYLTPKYAGKLHALYLTYGKYCLVLLLAKGCCLLNHWSALRAKRYALRTSFNDYYVNRLVGKVSSLQSWGTQNQVDGVSLELPFYQSK